MYLDPNKILHLNRVMEGALNGSRYARAAINIAARDLAGKRYGRPLCDLLGGSTGATAPTYYAIAVDKPEEQARAAREKQREGYRRIQIKISGRDIEEEIEAQQKNREALARWHAYCGRWQPRTQRL